MLPAGFFVLRTPLLPFDTLVALSSELEAPIAADDMAALREAFDRDRMRVRTRLRTLVQIPAIREALFIASPDLDRAIDQWLSNPEGERAAATERALLRYVIRMSARPTPFGLFAGVGVGMLADSTRLFVCSREESRRHTRLDMEYLVGLADALARDPAFALVVQYTPNTSLYRTADRWRYVETRITNNIRSHHLVAVDDSEALRATLARARDGATRAVLAAALVDQEVSPEEADRFVGELIDGQILIADLECPVTGPEPIARLNEIVDDTHEDAAHLLKVAASELQAIDLTGVGVDPARYRAMASRLESLPGKVDITRLFQVDLIKPAAAATLGPEVIDEISRGVEILRRLAPSVDRDELSRVRAAFAERYERREVPLAEALDEESGVGAALADAGERDVSPLLRGLDFPGAPATTAPWSHRENGLLQRLGETVLAGRHELALSERDVDALAAKNPLPLPDAYAVNATLISGVAPAGEGDEVRVLVHSVFGPPGATLMGRFCHADPELLAHVRRYLQEEEARDPEALFAEIVHLPEGRLGNILVRPVLRAFEIPYLGRSGAPPEQQIPVSDLTVALVDGRFVLRSRRLGRRIIPRLTTAHDFSHRSLGLYRFLCLLQSDRRLARCSWEWGVLAAFPFLPRVTCGRVALCRAVWRVTREEIDRLNRAGGAERYAEVQAWRAARGLPRWVVVTELDHALPLDLDNAAAVDLLVHMLKGRELASLTELYPGPDELCAGGPDGRYVHELVIPFLRAAETATPLTTRTVIGSEVDRRSAPSQRRFPPGSEWIYVKLYAGSGSADRLLSEFVAPLSRRLLAAGSIDRWFFVRYADPENHLRWRLRVSSDARVATVRRRIETAAAALVAEERVHRMAFDTYERELERYGGPHGIDAAEQWFCADSETVVDLLASLDDDEAGADQRWALAIASVDALLTDFALDLEAKLQMMQRLRDRFGLEFRADAAFGRQLAAKFRSSKVALEALIEHPPRTEPATAWRKILARRSEKTRPIVDTLRESDRTGPLIVPLDEVAESCVHMHLNRLFRTQHREHELVIYDFLVCLYEMQVGHQRRARVSS